MEGIVAPGHWQAGSTSVLARSGGRGGSFEWRPADHSSDIIPGRRLSLSHLYALGPSAEAEKARIANLNNLATRRSLILSESHRVMRH